MTRYVDTWCPTCRMWHNSVWVAVDRRLRRVVEVAAPILEEKTA